MPYGIEVILDNVGQPIGEWRANQDPADVQRFMEVPKTNAKGDVIMDGGVPVMVRLPLDDPKVVAALAAEDCEVVEGVIVKTDAFVQAELVALGVVEAPVREPAPVEAPVVMDPVVDAPVVDAPVVDAPVIEGEIIAP